MSLLDALTRGWYTGWSEAPELLAGGTGLLERLIPGRQESLTSFEEEMNKKAEEVRAKGGTGKSEGILEKIAEGLGAAPGTLATMAPFVAATGGAGAIAGPALGFGAHSLVRHGDEGLPQAFGYGLKGAAEGALFGGIGKIAGATGLTEAGKKLVSQQRLFKEAGKVAEAKALQPAIDAELNTLRQQMSRKGLHAAGTGGLVGGMTALHGGSLEDAVSSGATMGLLGMMASGKYAPRGLSTEEKLAEIRPEAERNFLEQQARPTKDATLETRVEFKPGEIKEFMLPGGAKTLAEAGIESRPYKELTDAGKERWSTFEDHLNAAQEGNRQVRTNDVVNTEAARIALSDENGNLYSHIDPTKIDAYGVALKNSLAEAETKVREAKVKRLEAEKTGDPQAIEYWKDAERRSLALMNARTLESRGFESQIGNAFRMIGEQKVGSPDWVRATKVLEKRGVFDKETQTFKEDVSDLMMMSEGNPALQARIAKSFDTPKLFDYFQEYWINGLLSGIPTQLVNINSNAYFAALDMVEKRIAVRGEAREGVISKEIAKGEIAADTKAAMGAIPKALRVFWEMTKSEDARLTGDLEVYNKVAGDTSKLDHTTRVIAGKTGQAIRFPSRILRGMDMAFKVLAGDRYGSAKAYRIAVEEGLSKEAIPARVAELLGAGGKEVDPRVLKAMKDNAERLTFTNKLPEAGQKLLALRDTELFGVKPLVGILPFVSTPYNVISQAVRRSPLGIIRMKDLKSRYDRGEITSQEYHREYAATALGTAMTVGLIGLAKGGLLTGGGPVNQQDRQNLIATGWRPYSLHVPGHGYLSLQRLEPLGTILGMAGDIAEFGDSEDKAGKMMALIKDNITDKSFLYGLESLAKAWSNPEMFFGTYYKQMSGSLVPTLLAKGQQAVDPYSRQVEAFGNKAGIPDAMAYRIPGLSQALPMKSTSFGEPSERWGVFGTETTGDRIISGVGSFLSPFMASAERQGMEVEKEVDRLRSYPGMPPAMPKRTKNLVLHGVHGESVKLTNEEYAVYDKYNAQAKQALQNVISSPQWSSIPDPNKAKLIDAIYSKFRRAANLEINNSIRRRTTVGN